MAVQDSENPSSSGPRLSPGDAAFERLQRREALRAKDQPVSLEPAARLVGPIIMPEDGELLSEPDVEPAPEALVSEHELPMSGPAEPQSVATLLSGVADAAAPQTGTEKAGVCEPVDRIIAMAAAFGIETVTSASADDEPAPVAFTEIADPAPVAPPAVAAAMPPAPSADATAARLEAALLDQLKSLEETLVEETVATPPRMPRAAPLRASALAPKAPNFVGPPPRSSFAPDPVRQRTYVDLRAPAPEKAASNDPPWRKYLAEPRRPVTRDRAVSPRPVTRPAGQPSRVVAAIHDQKAETEERGRGIRDMSAAAILGLGVGLGILVLIRPFTDPAPVMASVPESAPPVVAVAAAPDGGSSSPSAAPRSGSPVNQALATLLADPSPVRPAPGQPAVISEPGNMPPMSVAAASPEPPAPAPAVVAAAEPPVVIRPPPGETPPVARVPDFDAAQSGPLAYVPAIPSYDPVRQSLLEEEAGPKPQAELRTPVAASASVDEEPVSAAIRPGRATINGFVNLRSKPDNAAPVVAILAEGLSVKVIGCDYWCEVEAGGKRGFVFKKFVTR